MRDAAFGIIEWFCPGEHARVEATVAGLKRIGVRHLRTSLSWADWHRADGEAWFGWLIPRLAKDFELLPCLNYTPPSISIAGKSGAPPEDPKAFADFLDVVLDRFGRHFEYVELWNEPNNITDWDWRLDPEWRVFAQMIGMAAHWAHRRGFKTVLGGMCPTDPNWLDIVGRHGALADIDVVGIHGFPGTWESHAAGWIGWADQKAMLDAVLARHGGTRPLWITEVGYSTWRRDEIGQAEVLLDALAAPVDRIYWYGYQDLADERAHQEGHHFDERHYDLGLITPEGEEKLLFRMLEKGGVDEVRRVAALHDGPPAVKRGRTPLLITGGAGFIGCNLADRLAEEGEEVIVFDALRRPGVEENLAWLKARHGDKIHAVVGDLRDRWAVEDLAGQAGAVFHLAAQVAVTSSLEAPREDFDVNMGGTINLLEALRRQASPPPLIFASTNKVYGSLDDVALARYGDRYLPEDEALRRRGVDETRPLIFATPYGCSKGAADAYVLDYAKSFGLPAAVLRMSCIYGPRQFGTEDQGWVAHFLMRALAGEPVTVYGDGYQVRDILYVDDAVDAYLRVWRGMAKARGQAFNLGGGPQNAVSLRRIVRQIETLTGRTLPCEHAPRRAGDQLYYVSDTGRIEALLGWRARTPWQDGLGRLERWLVENAGLFFEPRRPRVLRSTA